MEILERFKEIIADVKEPFVIECGVCDGWHSNKMLEIIKEKDRPYIFHGFEPNKDLHLQILNNLKGHLMFNQGVISVFPNAVGAVNEETVFYKSGGSKVKDGKVVDNYYGSSSIRTPKIVKDSFPDMNFVKDKVFVITLDRHLEKYCLDRLLVDFIWADVQGAEIDLIKGGQNKFKFVRYFYTEYSNNEDYEGQAIGLQSILDLLPYFEIVEDYGEDALLKNVNL